mmetsp:Transcript_42766/g.110262  ORF Transcript_42766/g.110262 Transcript_42766/m.110262 type:complete len:121 (-) Transcript_42766:3373-3735(-)
MLFSRASRKDERKTSDVITFYSPLCRNKEREDQAAYEHKPEKRVHEKTERKRGKKEKKNPFVFLMGHSIMACEQSGSFPKYKIGKEKGLYLLPYELRFLSVVQKGGDLCYSFVFRVPGKI